MRYPIRAFHNDGSDMVCKIILAEHDFEDLGTARHSFISASLRVSRIEHDHAAFNGIGPRALR